MKNLKLKLVIETLIKLGIAIVLIVAASTEQQYTYYVLLRWFVFISLLYFSYRSYGKKEMGLIFLFLGIAIIFNPTQKFLFQKETWHLLDYLISGVIVLTIIYDWFRSGLAFNNSFLSLADKTLYKKRVAKEVLLFFSALTIMGLFWGSLMIWNTYHATKEKTLSKEIASLARQMYKLPSDQIKKIYDSLNKDLIVNYKVDNDLILVQMNQVQRSDFYAIPKGDEYQFIINNPSAKRLPNDPNGYSYFPLQSVKLQSEKLKSGVIVKYSSKSELGKLIKDKYPQYADFPDSEVGQKTLEKYPTNLDSLLVFDFVDLETFRGFLMQKKYRDNFYKVFRFEKYGRIYEVKNAQSTILKRESYDLGSKEVFETNVQLGLKFDPAVINYRDKIIKEISSKKTALQKASASVLSPKKVNEFLLTAFLIIAVILYPLRLTFLLIRWAIITLR